MNSGALLAVGWLMAQTAPLPAPPEPGASPAPPEPGASAAPAPEPAPAPNPSPARAASPQPTSPAPSDDDTEARLADAEAVVAGRVLSEAAIRAVLGTDRLELTAIDAQHSQLELESRRLTVRVSDLERQLATEVPQDLNSVRERDALTARLRLLNARQQILSGAHDLLTTLPAPAARSISYLNRERAPLRTYLYELEELDRAARQLDERLRVLGDFASSGRLFGFTADQARLTDLLERHRAELDQRRERLRRTRQSLAELVEQQEQTGKGVWALMVTLGVNDGAQVAIDDAFLEHLHERRRLDREVLQQEVRPVDVPPLARAIDRTLNDPQAISTVANASAALDPMQDVLLRLDLLLAPDVLRPRWEQAFARELVTSLEPLASERVRAQAYRFSAELLDDLRSEVEIGVRRLARWLEPIRGGGLDPSAWMSHRGPILRALLGLLLVGLVIASRKRFTRLVTAGVSRLARTSLFRGRVGGLVRWANLVHAMTSRTVTLLAIYGGLALLDWDSVGVRVARIFAWWGGLYWLGAAALKGLTRPVARGRQALLPAGPQTTELLQRTYSRVGFMMMLTAIVDQLAVEWFGIGRLRVVLGLFMGVWVAGWSLWAAVAWRTLLARAWDDLRNDGAREDRMATWMRGSSLGFVLSPIALLRLSMHALAELVRAALRLGGVFTYLRARTLRRMSERESTVTVPKKNRELPDDYLREFPLYPRLDDQGTVLLAREGLIEEFRRQFGAWRETRADGSLVVLGEAGMGKTTLLGQLATRTADVEISRHTLSRKIVNTQDLVRELALGPAQGAKDLDELIASLCAAPERLFLLDEAHNIFLRTMNGYRGFEALAKLVNATSEHVFWVLGFNSFAWQFLNESRGRVRYFRRVVQLPRWSAEEIEQLINRRNRRSGYTVEFDAALLDHTGSNRDELQFVESAAGYFRLLREASGGNPRVALAYWLESVEPEAEHGLRATLFRAPNAEVLKDLSYQLVFVLSAICQHENLSAAEIVDTLNTGPGYGEFALQFLLENGLIVRKPDAPDRVTLGAPLYPQVLRHLRSKHLLFEAGP